MLKSMREYHRDINTIFLLAFALTYIDRLIHGCSWFDGFEWAKLEDRTMPAPLKRPIKDNVDLSNFDEYPRDRDEPPDETSGWDSYF